ncbi:MAG TPA: serine/threonine-protein kinase [Thermoanaerobaculia bacterium]|nr:serine/threonine-protein kinase [Thermoanaerobaculia bacterium]
MMTAQEVGVAICKKAGYHFNEPAGEGSFKHTFRVERGGVFFALKLFKEPPTERSAREIEAMLRCDHPNIAKLVAVDAIRLKSNTFYYQVEEYLSGGTLTERIGSLDPSRIASLARTLSAALHHIGSHNLVHRDLKPDNIMFRDSSNADPVIVDFGLVRDLSATSLTATWHMRGPGSPFFAAPEQLNNEKELIKPWTDQFGLGVTLAYGLFEAHPYAQPRDSPETIVTRVAERRRPSPAFVAACNNAGLRPLVRMVLPFPIERFIRTHDLVDAWR